MESLTMLKQNLEITNTIRDEYLAQLLVVATEEVTRYGITLKQAGKEGYDSDQNLVVMYAAYLYRKRANDEPSMPRMLQWHLHQRLFAEKGATS